MRKGGIKINSLIFTFLVSVTFSSLLHVDTANAANIISRAIERAQPCSGLQTRQLGQTIGVDKFKTADLETLKIDVSGNTAKAALVASLACKTSDQAILRGDASAKFDASAEVDLTSCVVKQVSVRIVSTGGTFGKVIGAFQNQIQKAVETSISDQAKTFCQ